MIMSVGMGLYTHKRFLETLHSECGAASSTATDGIDEPPAVIKRHKMVTSHSNGGHCAARC